MVKEHVKRGPMELISQDPSIITEYKHLTHDI